MRETSGDAARDSRRRGDATPVVCAGTDVVARAWSGPPRHSARDGLMRTVLHELAVLSRQPAVAVAVMVVAVLLVAFVLVWPYGVPIAPDLNAYEQTRALASLLLSVALPWA